MSCILDLTDTKGRLIPRHCRAMKFYFENVLQTNISGQDADLLSYLLTTRSYDKGKGDELTVLKIGH